MKTTFWPMSMFAGKAGTEVNVADWAFTTAKRIKDRISAIFTVGRL